MSKNRSAASDHPPGPLWNGVASSQHTLRRVHATGVLQSRAGEVSHVSVVNQYSFLWLSAVGVGLLVLVLSLRRAPARQWLALVGLILGLVAAYAALRPTPGSTALEASLAASIGSGTPVLLEFQSPY